MKSNKNEILEAVETIKKAILQSQYRAGKAANAEMLSLYFGIGRYISENSRIGTWGTGAIEAISKRLQNEMPGLRGFSATSLKRMRIFYEEWSILEYKSAATIDDLKLIESKSSNTLDDLNTRKNNEIVPLKTVEIQNFPFNYFLSIGFSFHYEILAHIKNLEERIFYIKKTSEERWSFVALQKGIKQDLFHHQGSLPNNFSKTFSNSQQSLKAIETFKDEYLLDFINTEELGVRDIADIDERVLENEIVHNIKNFIQSLGSSFCFVGNQHRIVVEDEEFFIDLLFYNRELKSLVAIELKKGKFKPSYLGQLNFYLSALDKYEKQEGENPSIGLLLCHELNKSVVQLAVQDFAKPIGVATYKTADDIPEKYKALKPIVEAAPRLMRVEKE